MAQKLTIDASGKTADQAVEVKRKKSDLPELQRTEEVGPTRSIGHVAVVRDERVVKVERVSN